MRSNGFTVPHLELENQLMHRCPQLKYVEAAAVVRKARQELGMGKSDPVTEELKHKTEELLKSAVGLKFLPIDSDSITTPQTLQSYSYDNSEDSPMRSPSSDDRSALYPYQRAMMTTVPTQTVSILKNKSCQTKVLQDDTESSTFADDGDGDTTMTNTTSMTTKKKKRSKVLSRLFRVGRKNKKVVD